MIVAYFIQVSGLATRLASIKSSVSSWLADAVFARGMIELTGSPEPIKPIRLSNSVPMVLNFICSCKLR